MCKFQKEGVTKTVLQDHLLESSTASQHNPKVFSKVAMCVHVPTHST